MKMSSSEVVTKTGASLFVVEAGGPHDEEPREGSALGLRLVAAGRGRANPAQIRREEAASSAINPPPPSSGSPTNNGHHAQTTEPPARTGLVRISWGRSRIRPPWWQIRGPPVPMARRPDLQMARTMLPLEA